MDEPNAFDYVIVGAGSAGSVLASRLTEDRKSTVLLLEAGGSDLNFWVRVPIGYGKIFYDEKVNWKYVTEADPNRENLQMYWPRGKVLGGSSSINAMVYVRGHPGDYDDWEAVAPGWGWQDVAPLFRRMEDWDGLADVHRGSGGPLHVHDVSKEIHPLTRTYIEAAEQAGIPFNPDYNSGQMEGVSCYQITTKNGLRASTARSYLRPALKRQNLNIQTHALVRRLLFSGKRASGVEYEQNGQLKSVCARREVILCGGAINSPQLLQLSGIGPAELLSRQGINVVDDSNQVGQNLQDHLGSDILYRARVPSLNQELGPWYGKLMVGLQYLLTRKGPLSMSLNQGGGFVRVMKGATRPDLQLYFSPVSYSRAPVGARPLMAPDPFSGFQMGFNPCKPTSVGHLQIRSADPTEPPEIHANYLSTQYDRDMMLAGVRLMRTIADTSAFRSVIDAELAPGPKLISDEDLDPFIRQKSWTVFHQCSTCRMGSDPTTSVVDARLKVHGIKGLRVADASVFPTIPTGNTNAPAIMVGEKASDLIREDAKL
ncbi:MAG: GMC family oxidoreductase N-terminal domain-containing protein [Paracoccaceae bacterium]